MTDMGAENGSEPKTAYSLKSMTPIGRFATVDEIVGPIMYLLSEHFSMVSGSSN